MVSPIRMGGIASGMDTESMVKQLMQAEKSKVNKLFQNRQVNLWRQERYNTFSKSMANFILDMKKDLGYIKTTSTGTLLPGATDDFSWVKSATTSSSNISVSATAKATNGNHSITVHNLAEGITAASQLAVQGENENKTVAELGISAANFDLTINGATPISIKSTDKMSDVAKKINDLVGVSASYDIGTRRFFISSEKTGSDAMLNISAGAGSPQEALLNKMGLKITAMKGGVPVTENFVANTAYAGRNAKIDLDGATNLEFKNNNIAVNGLNIQLKSAGGPDSIQVGTDVNGVYDKIKKFVDKYNELIDSVNFSMKEKQYRDYKPLTDEQRNEMKENDIKLWDEKAKSGLLKSDEILSRILDKTRSGLYEKVNELDSSMNMTSSIGSLYELGITTGSYKDKGKLTIDEFALKKVISEDPEKVMNVLFKTSEISEARINSTDSDAVKAQKNLQNQKRREDSGIFVRIFDDLSAGIGSLVNKAGPGKEESLIRSVKSTIMIDYVTKGSKSDIDKLVDDFNTSMDKENVRLKNKESSYWSKFTRMEKLMSQMQSQSSWIAQQLGSK